MEELYLLFRLIDFCFTSSIVEKLGDEPPSIADSSRLGKHPMSAGIGELAQYIRYYGHNRHVEDAFVVLYAEVMRQTGRDISPEVTGRINHPYPAVRNFLTLAAEKLENENDPLAALQAIRQAVDTQREMRQRVDDDGCGIDCGFASALHADYMREDAR